MDVYEAVSSRRAVHGFTDKPVSRVVLERVLSAAAWSPSGSNHSATGPTDTVAAYAVKACCAVLRALTRMNLVQK